MDIGELNCRVAIESYSSVTDDLGGVTDTWATLATRWAKIEPLSGSELLHAAQQESNITHIITIRYLSTVTEDDRIYWDGRYFAIHTKTRINEGRVEFLEMVCEEGGRS